MLEALSYGHGSSGSPDFVLSLMLTQTTELLHDCTGKEVVPLRAMLWKWVPAQQQQQQQGVKPSVSMQFRSTILYRTASRNCRP